MFNTIDSMYIEVAVSMANVLSADPRTKVGCILVKNNEVISAGVNQLPVGAQVDLTNRTLKNQVITHAEVSAILNASEDVAGSTAYVTHNPCERCARALAAFGIITVMIPATESAPEWKDSHDRAVKLMEDRGITFKRVA